MLTAERRGVSSRRGMTVLGKIPAVPKPINLPSQRLENRGLDPNVEIVPRGSVTWGASSRSPPMGSNAWGLGSSPPVSGGSGWSAPSQTQTSTHSAPSSTTGSGAWPSSSSTTAPVVPRSGSRQATNGSDAWPAPSESLRPLSAGSASSQHLAPGYSSWSGPGGSRTLSSTNQLLLPHHGPAHGQRPRSAEVQPSASHAEPLLSDLDSSPFRGGGSPMPAWGGAGVGQKRQEENSQQGSRFLLKNNDFPTLGADKDPDNQQPQQSVGGNNHQGTEDRPPRSPGYFDMPPASPGREGGGMDRPSGHDSWRRDANSYAGPHDSWRRDGSHPHGHMGQPPDSWRRDAGGSAGPQGDSWRRDTVGHNSFNHGAPPPGGGRYPMPPPEGFGPMPQRFVGGPGMFNGPPGGPSMGPGPRGFLPVDGYGPQGPFPRPGPGLHGPMVYGNVSDREMAMMGGRQGPYGMPVRGPHFAQPPPGQFGMPGKGPPHFQNLGNMQPVEGYGKWGRYNGRPDGGPRPGHFSAGGPPPMGHAGSPREYPFGDPRGELLGFDLDDARPSGSHPRDVPRDSRRDDGIAESHPLDGTLVEGGPSAAQAQQSPTRNEDSRAPSAEGPVRDAGEPDNRQPFHTTGGGSGGPAAAAHGGSGPFGSTSGHQEWALVADEAMDFSKPAFSMDLSPASNMGAPPAMQSGTGPAGAQGQQQQSSGHRGGRAVGAQGGGPMQNWRGAQGAKTVPVNRSMSPDWKAKKAAREVQSGNGNTTDVVKSARGPPSAQTGGMPVDQGGNQQQAGKAVRILKRHGEPDGTVREPPEISSPEATATEPRNAAPISSPGAAPPGSDVQRDTASSDGNGKGGLPQALTPSSPGQYSAAQSTSGTAVVTSAQGTVANVQAQTAPASQAPPVAGSTPGIASLTGNGDHGVSQERSPDKMTDPQAQRERAREATEQRVRQRQEEEERRGREQKARAQAKLEELNRRAGPQQLDAAPAKRAGEKGGKEVSVAVASGATLVEAPAVGVEAGAGSTEGNAGQEGSRAGREGGRRGDRRNGRVHKEREGGRGKGGASAPNVPASGGGPTSPPLPPSAALAAPNPEPLLPSPSPAQNALLPSPQVQNQRGGGSQPQVSQGQAKNSPRHRRKQGKQGDAGNQETSASGPAAANVVETKDGASPLAVQAGVAAPPPASAQGDQSIAESGGRKRRDARPRARRGEGRADADGTNAEQGRPGGGKAEESGGSSRGRRGGSGRREGRDRLPQDVRVTDKASTEAGIEAVPTAGSNQSGRSRGGGRGSASAAAQSGGGQEKPTADVAPGSAGDSNQRGRRADMERYHPKPLAQKIEQQLHSQDGHPHQPGEQETVARPVETKANGTDRPTPEAVVKSAGGGGAGSHRQRQPHPLKQEAPPSAGTPVAESAATKADSRPVRRGVSAAGEPPQRPGSGPQRPGGGPQSNVSSKLAAAILGGIPGGGNASHPQQQQAGARGPPPGGVFVTPPMVRPPGGGPQARGPASTVEAGSNGAAVRGASGQQGGAVAKVQTVGRGAQAPVAKGSGAAEAACRGKVSDGATSQQHSGQQQQPLQPLKAPQQQAVSPAAAPPQGGALSKGEGPHGQVQGNIIRGAQFVGQGVRVRNIASNTQNGTGPRSGSGSGGRGSGRSGSTSSGRGADAENRRDGAVKPRMVINATGGVLPGQTAIT